MACNSGSFQLNRPNKSNININLQKMTIDEGILSVEFVVFYTSLPIQITETLLLTKD
jgi:hypothetical protein